LIDGGFSGDPKGTEIERVEERPCETSLHPNASFGFRKTWKGKDAQSGISGGGCGLGVLSASGAYAQSMEVISAEVHKGATIENDQVFKGFGCTGDNTSPSLS
jgi:hypothetical protein